MLDDCWAWLGTWQCLGSVVKNMIEENIEEKVKQHLDTCLPFMNLLDDCCTWLSPALNMIDRTQFDESFNATIEVL